MHLDFTDEQEELRASVRAVLARECPPRAVREAFEARRAGRPAPETGLWARMVELGWPALTLPPEVGGLGAGAVELALVAEELGRVMAPGPFLATVTQFAPLVRASGDPAQQAALLGPVARGARTGALVAPAGIPGGRNARSGRGPGRPGPAVRAEPAAGASGGGRRWLLSGASAAVLDAPCADDLAVVGELDTPAGGAGAFALAASSSGVSVRELSALDASRPLGRVHLERAPATLLGDPDTPPAARVAAIAAARDEALVALAAETVGTAQALFDLTLEHAKQREQFGVPIGSFQAVKHKLADMYVALERARAVVTFAAATVDEDDPRRPLACAMAKAAAGDAQRLVTKDGIQLHGGIGYTWEHDAHLLARRLRTNDALLGDAPLQRARVAELALPA